MDIIYQALACEIRRRILELLNNGDMYVSEIVEKIGLAQGTVSLHLGILKKAGMVTSRAEGKWKKYMINRDQIEKIVQEVRRLYCRDEVFPVVRGT